MLHFIMAKAKRHTTMEEIVMSMQHINEMVFIIDSQGYPAKIKDDSKRIALEAFTTVKEMTDPIVIRRLIADELRNKYRPS